jgi:hypothetical protein
MRVSAMKPQALPLLVRMAMTISFLPFFQMSGMVMGWLCSQLLVKDGD